MEFYPTSVLVEKHENVQKYHTNYKFICIYMHKSLKENNTPCSHFIIIKLHVIRFNNTIHKSKRNSFYQFVGGKFLKYFNFIYT